jgi:hypothetical protein
MNGTLLFSFHVIWLLFLENTQYLAVLFAICHFIYLFCFLAAGALHCLQSFTFFLFEKYAEMYILVL